MNADDLLRYAQTRYDDMFLERGKAMERGDKAAELVYQLLLMEYDALVQFIKALQALNSK